LFYPWNIDLLRMLADLREQREQIDQAIIVMERIAAGQGKRRGSASGMDGLSHKATRQAAGQPE